MSNYSLGIVTHPKRAALATELMLHVGADLMVSDDGTRGVGRNHLETLLQLSRNAAFGGSEWVVVLEDDAIPALNFHRNLSAALDVAPSPVVSLYNGTGYPAQHQAGFMEAVKSDACWILHDNMRHAVGYALRRSIFEFQFFELVSFLVDQGYPMDDALTKWCRRWQHPVAYTNPSLVNHKDGESIIDQRLHRGKPVGARNRPRVAHNFGQRVTWNGSSCIV